jgi:3-dehydroquinate synthase
MKKLMLHGSDLESTILIGEHFQNVGNYLPQARVILITDRQVYESYSEFFSLYETIITGTGESIKTLETITAIYEQFIEREVDRSTFLLGVGGGVVCDITGFAASTYLRGLRFGFMPTTLLAQADAAVGGKNGVNFHGLKNRIGTFRQPDFVLCDPSFFRTLPKREFHSGLAEVLKQAIIADKNLFGYIENNITGILALKPEVMEQIISDSLRIKSDIAGRDERETGERRKLNFGHTVGHAIEQLSNLTHGEAVSVGMIIAATASSQTGLLPEKSLIRIINLIKQLNLPAVSPVPAGKVIDILKQDKKRDGETIHFVWITDIGHAVVKETALTQLADILLRAFNNTLLI